MTRYLIQPRAGIFPKGYEDFSFANNMRKCMRKCIGKNLSSKYSQKFLDHAKQSATDAFKTVSKRTIHNNESNKSRNNKSADKITKSQEVQNKI